MTSNTIGWTESVLARAGELVSSDMFGNDDRPWFGASIDTRSDCSGRLFFALRGERTDGHRFVVDAAAKGCPAVVVDEAAIEDELRQRSIPYLRVKDVLCALQQLARDYRKALGVRVVAITGSAGKTTTKQFVCLLLKKKYKVHCSQGNYNNHIGVPLTILGTGQDAEYLVSEVAANHLGEIDFLSRMLRPDVGVITNIGDAHIGLFGGREKIAQAKAEVFAGIDPQGFAVLPGDDEYIETLRNKCGCRSVTFGHGPDSAVRVSRPTREEGKIHFEVNEVDFSIRSFGVYNALNAGAACAVGELCGVSLEESADALAGYQPMEGRARRHEHRGVTIIDDTYNANPTSVMAALEALATTEAQRRIAVLGEMAELGDYAQDAHRRVGRCLTELGIDRAYWVGGHAEEVQRGMGEGAKVATLDVAPTVDELIGRFKLELEAGDVILVKASRAIRLDRFVDHVLRAYFEAES